jgi:hypothetical protein
VLHKKNKLSAKNGAIFIIRMDIGVGGPENGNFLLIYVVKISLPGSEKPQNTLT